MADRLRLSWIDLRHGLAVDVGDPYPALPGCDCPRAGAHVDACVDLLVSGSTRETVSEPPFVTHTHRSPMATSVGWSSTGMLIGVGLSAGSSRITVSALWLTTQIEPKPTATEIGLPLTGIRVPASSVAGSMGSMACGTGAGHPDVRATDRDAGGFLSDLDRRLRLRLWAGRRLPIRAIPAGERQDRGRRGRSDRRQRSNRQRQPAAGGARAGFSVCRAVARARRGRRGRPAAAPGRAPRAAVAAAAASSPADP